MVIRRIMARTCIGCPCMNIGVFDTHFSTKCRRCRRTAYRAADGVPLRRYMVEGKQGVSLLVKLPLTENPVCLDIVVPCSSSVVVPKCTKRDPLVDASPHPQHSTLLCKWVEPAAVRDVGQLLQRCGPCLE